MRRRERIGQMLGPARPLAERTYTGLFAGTVPRIAARRVRSAADPRAAAVEAAALATAGSALDAGQRGWAERIEAARRERFDGPLAAAASIAGIHEPWGRALMTLARELPARNVLEVGTGVGISAAYLAAGLELQDHSASDGAARLVTIEMGEARHNAARELASSLGLDRIDARLGKAQDLLPDAIEKLTPIDLVFLDAAKGAVPMREWVDLISPALSDRGVIAIDDVRWNGEMRRQWARLRREERWALTADLWRVGLLAPPSSPGGTH